ncbi:hypothetical protein [Orenia marismortui]|uniref:hypothetical protein n=1 Tax=Orenia marismortui TaxID=46469 RepID=UPI0003727049|nr:hypothetical protein [Orenia marismortui]
MKKRILIYSTFLIILFSTTTLAAEYQIVGGYYYLDLDPEINDYIQEYNHSIDNIIEFDESLGYTFNKKVIDPLDQIEDANGYYIGISTTRNNLLITAQYEEFSNEDNASVYTEWTDPNNNNGTTVVKLNNEIKVQGIYGEVGKKLNDYLQLTGGIGYYTGEINNEYYINISNSTNRDVNNDSDLEGELGFKIGSNFHYSLTDNLNFLCNISYRYLKMDLDENITENNIEISELDLSGFETKVGFTYNF